MEIPLIIIELFGVGLLCYFSWLDIKCQEIDNKPILMSFLLGIVFCCFNNAIFENLLAVFIFLGIGFLLWALKIWGGADAKIFAILPLFFGINSFYDLIPKLLIFLIIFGIIGALIGLTIKFGAKKKGIKEIPFVPIILISFLIICLKLLNYPKA